LLPSRGRKEIVHRFAIAMARDFLAVRGLRQGVALIPLNCPGKMGGHSDQRCQRDDGDYGAAQFCDKGFHVVLPFNLSSIRFRQTFYSAHHGTGSQCPQDVAASAMPGEWMIDIPGRDYGDDCDGSDQSNERDNSDSQFQKEGFHDILHAAFVCDIPNVLQGACHVYLYLVTCCYHCVHLFKQIKTERHVKSLMYIL
jgi:hypothetical protein